MNENAQQAADSARQAGEQGFWAIMENPFVQFLGKLILAVVVVLILIIISKIIAGNIKKKVIENTVEEDDEYANKVGGLIADLMYYSLVLFSLFIGFQIIGFDVGWLLGGLSVGLGFAFKEILGNIFAGVMILTTKEFKLGDKISIDGNFDGSEDYFGTIDEITMRYTVIRTLTNNRIILPNLTMITSPVITFSSEDTVTLEAHLRVHFDDNIEDVLKLIKEGIKELDLVKNKENINVIPNKFLESGVEVSAYYEIDPKITSAVIARGEVYKKINEVCKENNIRIPYPHTAVTVDKNDSNLLKSFMYIINKFKQ